MLESQIDAEKKKKNTERSDDGSSVGVLHLVNLLLRSVLQSFAQKSFFLSLSLSLSLLCFPCAGVSFCGFSFSVVVEEDFHRICERCACSSSSVLRVNRLLDNE